MKSYLLFCISIIAAGVMLFGFTASVEAGHHDGTLDVSVNPYFRGAWTVGLTATWPEVEGAEYYRVLHFRKDAAGEALVRHARTATSSSSGTFRNAGAPHDCYYHWVKVEAKDDDGETLEYGTNSLCHIGFLVESSEAVGTFRTEEEMAETLSYLSRVLRNLFQRTLSYSK